MIQFFADIYRRTLCFANSPSTQPLQSLSLIRESRPSVDSACRFIPDFVMLVGRSSNQSKRVVIRMQFKRHLWTGKVLNLSRTDPENFNEVRKEGITC